VHGKERLTSNLTSQTVYSNRRKNCRSYLRGVIVKNFTVRKLIEACEEHNRHVKTKESRNDTLKSLLFSYLINNDLNHRGLVL